MDECEINKPLEQYCGTGGQIEPGDGGRIGVVGSPMESLRTAPVPFAALILLLAVSLMLPLVKLGEPELGSPHEARVVVTGHNMAESGDWVVPYFNGSLRLQKPPLPYWTIAVLAKAFGPLDEWLFRLPSALMGIGGVILTLLIARIVFDWKTGLVAALIQSLTVKYVIESRLARVDIYLTFWVLVSLFLLSVIFFGKRRRDWLWLFLWAAIAMGFLAKWVVVFIFVMPPMLYGLWAYPERRARLRWHLLGVCIFSLLALSWVALLAYRLGWETLRTGWAGEVSENVTSAYHRANHGIFYYLGQLFVLSFPWSALVPVALTVPFWPQPKPERRKLLWMALTVFFAIAALSLVSKKKADYLLPALPFMTILAAKAWEILTDEIAADQGEKGKLRRGALGISQAAVFVVVGAAVLVYCFFDNEMKRYGAIIVSGLSLSVGGGLAGYFIHRGKGWPALVSLFFGTAVFGYVLFGLFLPRETRISSAEFGRSIEEIVGKAPLVYFCGMDDTLVYHLDRTILRANEVEQLRRLVDEHPDAFVLAQGKHLDAAREVTEHIVLHHPNFRDVSIPLPGKDDIAFDIYLLRHGDSGEPVREFAGFSPEPPDWLNVKNLWLAFGFLAQGMFFSRFLLQWIVSEKKKKSVIPVGFWWLSIAGGIMLFSYAVHRRDPVFIVGQGTGVFIYLRNLYFIYYKRPSQGLPSPEESGPVQ
ncbi:MAG: lipid-A-disaccharide synthase N-terminal domain-containing protein [Sedimentisphaerales bacterium]